MEKIQVGDQEVGFNAGENGAEFTVGENKVRIDSEGNLLGAEAFGNTIEQVGGDMVVTRPDGTRITMRENGGIELENFIPKSVGIKDLSEVAGYAVSVDGEHSIHRVDFKNGAHAVITYTLDGAFAGLSGNNLQQLINKDSEFLIGQGKSIDEVETA